MFIWARDRFFKTAYENSGFALMLESLGELLRASALASLLCRLLRLERYPAPKQNWLGVGAVMVLLLALVGALFFLPPIYVAGGAIGIAGALTVLAWPEAGVMTVLATAPFLPTMVLAGMLGYVCVCFFLKLLTDARYAAVMDSTGLLIIFYALIGLFYGLTSFTPSGSIPIAMLTTLLMLSYFLTVTLMNTKWNLEVCVFVFSASAALTGLYGLYQKISGKVDMTWVDRELFSDLRLRIYSTFANPNVYGTYLLLAIPICAVMIYVSGRRFVKLYYCAVTVLLLYNLGYSYSRGCYLALAVAAFVFVLLMAKRFIALFAAALMMVPLMLPATMYARFASILNMGAGDSSTRYRLDIWQGTLRILHDFWFAGLGQGIQAYNAVYPLYAFNDVSAPHSHNLYLQILVETGIVGLLVFLGILFAFFKTQLSFFYKTRNRRTKCLIAGFISATLAFLFQGMFDYVFYNYRVLLIFFLFMGMGSAIVYVRLHGDFN